MSDDRKSVCSIHEQAYVGRCPYCVEPEALPEERGPAGGDWTSPLCARISEIMERHGLMPPRNAAPVSPPESAVVLPDAEFPYGEWASLPGGARFRECIKSLGEGRITEEQAKKILALPDRDAAAPEEDG